MKDCKHYFERGTAQLSCLGMIASLVLPLILAAPVCGQQASPEVSARFVNTLMPLPEVVVGKPGGLKIDGSLTYALSGNFGVVAREGVVRLLRRLEMRSGVSIRKTPAAHGGEATLTIDVRDAESSATPEFGEDESYTLDVDEHHVALRAQTEVGALRGMETLLQLVQPAGSAYVFPAVHIEDAPRFPWRGLLLDPGRHFLPVANIYRTLDAMAAVKLNVLHWHLSEDQGFRIESKVFPKLQEMGSDGNYYTQEQAREIVAYAAARGIRVVPEFDMPGHSTSWMVGYPELASAPGPYFFGIQFGIYDAAMNPINDATYEFLDRFLGEMSEIFPDAYMHIGGDESNGKQWRANAEIKAFMDAHGMKTTPELQAYFNTRVEKILAKYHKKMVGWDEVLNPAISPGVTIQVWHENEFLVNAAKQGHAGYYSQPYYLDHMRTAAEMFLADPVPAGADLTPEQLKLILGGEACMWGENVIPETIDSRIWPRTAAIAERFWSPATDRDTDDIYRRLAVETVRLEAAGLTHVSGPARMQRQIAGTAEIEPLEIFAGTLQPGDFGVRGQEQRPSTLTVFDRLADGVRPDPPLRHQLTLLVYGALHGDAGDRQHLRTIFQSWIDAAPALDRLEADSPLLQEASGHIAVFPKLGTMGIEALSYIASGNKAGANWQTAQMAILSEASKPKELLDFVVLDPLKKLVTAAAEGVETDAIQSYMQPLVNNGTIAGAVTLVATKDRTVYLKATGYRDLDARSPMPADAMFWIASVSKPLTATAMMMLVDEGKVKLNDPVEKYLPEFKGQKVELKQGAGGEPKLVKASHPIRVREILSHTSGLRFRSAAQPGALDLMPLKDQVRSFAAEPLVYQPGTDYQYSNEGINTAARIIEVVSGMPYEQFMQERLFSPLGMKDTTFWPNAEQIGRLAESYKLDEETKELLEVPIDQLTYPLDDRQHRFPMPAGGVFSTASDLERFCRMILNGGSLEGKRYISETSLHAMTSTENSGLGKTNYGFGWTISASGFGHGGAYKNAIDIDTATGRILVFMVQQAGAWGTADGDAMIPRLKELANTMVAGQGTH